MADQTLAVAAGDRLVVRRAIALPAICMKCGAVDRAIVRRDRTFWFTTPWLYALLALGPFGALGVLALTKTAALSVPLCAPCDARWNAGASARKIITSGMVAITVAFALRPLFVPGVGSHVASAIVAVVGLALIVGVQALTASRVLRAASIDAERIALAGVHRAAIDATCRSATPGPEVSAHPTTRLAVRLLVAHLLAYTLAVAWAIAAIPIVVRTLPLDIGDDDAKIGALVLQKTLVPFAGVWVLVHLTALPWAFTRAAARLKWTRAIFVVAVALLFVASAIVGGEAWWKLVRAS